MIAKKLVTNILRGNKCFYCGKYGLYRLHDKRLKCKHCKSYYSLNRLRKDLGILYYFYIEVSARKTSREFEITYKSVRDRYMKFRQKITEYLDEQFTKLRGELELDETYFGGKRKGKRGRGAYNKAIVFGILERNGKVYTRVVPNVTAKTLMDEIKAKTNKGSVFYTDCFKSYNSLKQYGKHLRINKKYAYARGRTHVNGMEGFWSYAKERFHKYHGISMANYPLYLKEMEFRYNHRNADVFKLLVNICLGGNLVRK